MTRRVQRAAIVSGIMILLTVCTLSFQGTDEPSYKGKLLSAWLDDLVPCPDGRIELSDKAVQAVHEMGPDVIPQLLSWVKRSDLPGFWRLRYDVGIPVPLNDVWRTRAIRGFRALGDTGAAAIPELVSLTLESKDEAVRHAAINALTYGHPEINRLLGQALRDPDVELRRRAAFALGCLRQHGSIELLTSALSDMDSQVRSEAAKCLGIHTMPLLSSSTINALKSLLSDSDGAVRSAAQLAIDRQIEYRQNGVGVESD